MSDTPAREVSIAAARDRFARLVHEVESGPPVAVTRRGQPVAVLLSMTDFERLSAGDASLWEAVEAYRADADFSDWQADTDPWDDVRDQSPGRPVAL